METEVQKRVSAFFEGEMSQDEREALRAELADNEALRAEFEFQEALLFRMQREAMQRYEEKGAFDRVQRPRWYAYAAAAAIALIVALGWLFTRRPESPAPSLLAFAAPAAHLPGQTKSQDGTGIDSLAYWLETGQYLPLRHALADFPDRLPRGPLSPAYSDSLYTLAVAQLHGDAPQPEQATRWLETLVARSEDAYLVSWAQRQLVYAAYRQGQPELVRQRLQILAKKAADPALRREAQQLLDQL